MMTGRKRWLWQRSHITGIQALLRPAGGAWKILTFADSEFINLGELIGASRLHEIQISTQSLWVHSLTSVRGPRCVVFDAERSVTYTGQISAGMVGTSLRFHVPISSWRISFSVPMSGFVLVEV